MHPASADIVAAARMCVGTPTRPQGRRPGLALDCVGVVLVAARAAGVRAGGGCDYSLRADNAARLGDGLIGAGCSRVAACASGDVAEIEVAPGQRHLAVLCGDNWVHAHFGVGRVVEAPLPPEWRIAACWRLPEND